MSEKEIVEIADKAKFIVSGYAFSGLADDFVSILNLNYPDCAMVVKRDGEMIETNMDLIAGIFRVSDFECRTSGRAEGNCARDIFVRRQ